MGLFQVLPESTRARPSPTDESGTCRAPAGKQPLPKTFVIGNETVYVKSPLNFPPALIANSRSCVENLHDGKLFTLH